MIMQSSLTDVEQLNAVAITSLLKAPPLNGLLLAALYLIEFQWMQRLIDHRKMARIKLPEFSGDFKKPLSLLKDMLYISCSTINLSISTKLYV